MGASGAALTTSWNPSVTVKPLHEAETDKFRLPLKFLGGVPEKVCVAGSNVIQAGSSLVVKVSPLPSTSLNVPCGTV